MFLEGDLQHKISYFQRNTEWIQNWADFRRTSISILDFLRWKIFIYSVYFLVRKILEVSRILKSKSCVDVCRTALFPVVRFLALRLPEGRRDNDTRGGDRKKTEESIKSRAVLLRVFSTFAGVMCQAYGTGDGCYPLYDAGPPFSNSYSRHASRNHQLLKTCMRDETPSTPEFSRSFRFSFENDAEDLHYYSNIITVIIKLEREI